jgi:hypothetical protein
MFLYKIWQYFLRDLKTDLCLLFVVFNVSFHNTPFPSWIGDQFFFGRGNKGTPPPMTRTFICFCGPYHGWLLFNILYRFTVYYTCRLKKYNQDNSSAVNNMLYYIYIFILITKWHRYREDIDTIIYNIYNIYTILEHRKTVSSRRTHPFIYDPYKFT